jgi:hypothetical protein
MSGKEYGVIESLVVGDRDEYGHGSINDAFEDARVEPRPQGGMENIL